MSTVSGNPKQLEPQKTLTITRTPFVHPKDYMPGIDAARWRLVASEPINRMARRMIQREISSLNWRIRPLDRDNINQRSAAVYYSEVFKDYRDLVTKVLKGVCELPQGGAWEVGWRQPALFGEGPRGTLEFVDFLDAGTLHPTTSDTFPVVMMDPTNRLRKAYFKDEQLVRILAHPRDEFDREWWQESPTEASYLAIEALSRIYVYSLKQLMDTPPLGILDLMDFSEQAAKNWAGNLREMVEGVDHIKVPVLYEHTTPAQYIKLSTDFDTLRIPQQFEQYAELILGNYGLSVDDLRILGRAHSKAGVAVSQKVTLRTGIGFFAELVKDSIQSVLPDFLVFEYSEPDIEEERSKAQIEAARTRALQTIPWLPVAEKVRILNAWGVFPIELDPEAIEKAAKKMALEAAALQAAATPSPGGGNSGSQKLKPGQLERGEGRIPDALEDDAKMTAATGTRTFAKGVRDNIEKAANDIVNFLSPPTTGRYGRKKKVAADRLQRLLIGKFQEVGRRFTPSLMATILDVVYTQFPNVVESVDTRPPEAKSWATLVDGLVAGDYVEKQDDIEARINQLLDILLDELEIYNLSDEEFLELVTETLALAYADGLLGMAEIVQADLHARGIVRSPAVLGAYQVTNPRVLEILAATAAEAVKNIDSGTKFFLRRLITQGAMEGLSSDQLTERIQAELFALPTVEAGKLSQRRIRSIVNTELNRVDTMGRLEQMKQMGMRLKRWITRGVGVCPLCIRNESQGSVPLDFEFESVFGATQGPPGHPDTCHCSIGADAEELNNMGMIAYWTGGDGEEKAEVVEKAQSADIPANNLFYMLRFHDIAPIQRFQAYLKEALTDADIRWESPSDFHLTLVYVPDVDPTMVGHLTMFLNSVPGITLETDGIGTFSEARGDRSNVLWLQVRKTPALADLQARIFSRVRELGIETSPYSQPGQWIPHITLAYKDTPFDESKIPDLGGIGLGMFRVDASMGGQLIASSDGYIHPPVKVFAS